MKLQTVSIKVLVRYGLLLISEDHQEPALRGGES